MLVSLHLQNRQIDYILVKLVLITYLMKTIIFCIDLFLAISQLNRKRCGEGDFQS